MDELGQLSDLLVRRGHWNGPNIFEVFWSAVHAQQFLLVEEICHRVSSKHFPVAENDVPE